MIPIVWQVPDSTTPAPAPALAPEIQALFDEAAAAYARLQTLSAQVTVRRARGREVAQTTATLLLRRPDRLLVVATTPGGKPVRTRPRTSEGLADALLRAEAFAAPIVAELLTGKRTGEELARRLLPEVVPEAVTRTEAGDLIVVTAPLPGREGERNELRYVFDRTDRLIRQIVLSLARPDRPPVVVTEEWTRVQIDRPLPDRLFAAPAPPKPRRR